MTLAIDVLIAAGLVWLAIQTVQGASLFRSIVMFIVFGLFMALAWARLQAGNLALAEAAIGAGLTGALLLGAYRRLYHGRPAYVVALRRRVPLALPLSLLAAALVAAISYGVLTLDLEPAAAGVLARHHNVEVGVDNAVTAVLLVFRGWDTMLEMAVLLVAFVGARVIAIDDDITADSPPPRSTMVDALLCIVVPLTIVTGAYLLRIGNVAPGGAFQGGAVLAAGGVLLVLSGRLQAVLRPNSLTCLILILGIATFGGFGVASLVSEGLMLALPGPFAIHVVEFALTMSIALTLVLLFAGGSSLRRPPP